jgi:hypothetical protein
LPLIAIGSVASSHILVSPTRRKNRRMSYHGTQEPANEKLHDQDRAVTKSSSHEFYFPCCAKLHHANGNAASSITHHMFKKALRKYLKMTP